MHLLTVSLSAFGRASCDSKKPARKAPEKKKKKWNDERDGTDGKSSSTVETGNTVSLSSKRRFIWYLGKIHCRKAGDMAVVI